MAKKRSIKKELIEWGIYLGIFGTLYFTGLHTPVIGFLQRGIVATGVLTPDTDEVLRPGSYDLILTDLDGNDLDLELWKNETIFLNFWATWCAPCRAEMPDINDLFNDVGDQVNFALISVDKDREKARQFIENSEYDFPVYFIKSSVPKAYETRTIPTTYVISPNGDIVVENKGMAKYSGSEFSAFLRNL